MNALQIVLVIAIALVGYPIGLLISRVCKEELIIGRRWFKLIMLASIIGIIISLFLVSSVYALTGINYSDLTKRTGVNINKPMQDKISAIIKASYDKQWGTNIPLNSISINKVLIYNQIVILYVTIQ